MYIQLIILLMLQTHPWCHLRRQTDPTTS